MLKISGDIPGLSIPERIQLVEDIWDTIALNEGSVALTDEEKQMIDKKIV